MILFIYDSKQAELIYGRKNVYLKRKKLSHITAAKSFTSSIWIEHTSILSCTKEGGKKSYKKKKKKKNIGTNEKLIFSLHFNFVSAWPLPIPRIQPTK